MENEMGLTEQPRMMDAQYCVSVIVWHVDNFLEVINLQPCLFEMSVNMLWADVCKSYLEP